MSGKMVSHTYMLRNMTVLILLYLVFLDCEMDAVADEDFISSYLDGACLRRMDVESFGENTSLAKRDGKLIVQKVPLSGDGIVMHVRFKSYGLCSKGHYKLAVETSGGLKITGSPSKKGTRRLIETGVWPKSYWDSDLMWAFASSKQAHNNEQWVVIELRDKASNEKVLGGRVRVHFVENGPERTNGGSFVNSAFVSSEYTGIYIDEPNDISSLNKIYGTNFAGDKGVTSFDVFSTLNIHYIVVNGIAELFAMDLNPSDEFLLKRETVKFIHYLKRVRPDIRIWFAVPSWKFAIPGSQLNDLITWINSISDIDGLVLDWETNPSLFDDVPSIFRSVRKLLDRRKVFVCTPTSFIGRRGLYWNEVDSLHSGCDLFLPMFYVPQQEDFLRTAKKWLESWSLPQNKPASPIAPLLIPIHKATDNTPMPASLMKYTIALIAQYKMPGFFVYRPYSATSQVKQLLSRIYGRFNVDFTFTGLVLRASNTSLEISGAIVNKGTTRVSFPVDVELVAFNANREVERKRFKVYLDGDTGNIGRFVQHIENRYSITRIKLIVDPIEIYMPTRLKIKEKVLFSIMPKKIDVPETNERNNSIEFVKVGYKWKTH